jgi:chorismate-pyruvate lyase
VLLDSSGTVTQFLETITGELILADVVRQSMVKAEPGNGLGVATGQVVTRRIAILVGRTTHLQYLYAETSFAPERLPEQVLAQLETTDHPIGQVLVAHGLTLGREPVPEQEARTPSPEIELAAEIVFTRAYRLMIDASPVFAIREWFLRSVLEALERQLRGQD